MRLAYPRSMSLSSDEAEHASRLTYQVMGESSVWLCWRYMAMLVDFPVRRRARRHAPIKSVRLRARQTGRRPPLRLPFLLVTTIRKERRGAGPHPAPATSSFSLLDGLSLLLLLYGLPAGLFSFLSPLAQCPPPLCFSLSLLTILSHPSPPSPCMSGF